MPKHGVLQSTPQITRHPPATLAVLHAGIARGPSRQGSHIRDMGSSKKKMNKTCRSGPGTRMHVCTCIRKKWKIEISTKRKGACLPKRSGTSLCLSVCRVPVYLLMYLGTLTLACVPILATQPLPDLPSRNPTPICISPGEHTPLPLPLPKPRQARPYSVGWLHVGTRVSGQIWGPQRRCRSSRACAYRHGERVRPSTFFPSSVVHGVWIILDSL